jgi:hypothetical protein
MHHDLAKKMFLGPLGCTFFNISIFSGLVENLRSQTPCAQGATE